MREGERGKHLSATLPHINPPPPQGLLSPTRVHTRVHSEHLKARGSKGSGRRWYCRPRVPTCNTKAHS